jgi:hypothetical protein
MAYRPVVVRKMNNESYETNSDSVDRIEMS